MNCAYGKYVELWTIREKLRDMREFGLMHLTDDRLQAIANWLSPEELKRAAIDIQNRMG